MADIYKETITHKFDNCIVRVHIPDLTQEERTKRYKMIQAAAEKLLKAEYIRKKGEETNEKAI